MVWPSKVRRGSSKHAFEDALDQAFLDPDGNPILFDDDVRVTGPAVGTLGDIPIATGYVAHSSLSRAYDAEIDVEPEPVQAAVRPREAARKLQAQLVSGKHAPDELRQLRRRFAAANHPDRVAASLRAEAVAAMAEVNAAIDQALRGELRSKAP